MWINAATSSLQRPAGLQQQPAAILIAVLDFKPDDFQRRGFVALASSTSAKSDPSQQSPHRVQSVSVRLGFI
jgi:hypothetical protein